MVSELSQMFWGLNAMLSFYCCYPIINCQVVMQVNSKESIWAKEPTNSSKNYKYGPIDLTANMSDLVGVNNWWKYTWQGTHIIQLKPFHNDDMRFPDMGQSLWRNLITIQHMCMYTLMGAALCWSPVCLPGRQHLRAPTGEQKVMSVTAVHPCDWAVFVCSNISSHSVFSLSPGRTHSSPLAPLCGEQHSWALEHGAAWRPSSKTSGTHLYHSPV